MRSGQPTFTKRWHRCFLFEHQLPGCYKEVLYRRGIIDCPLKRNGKMPLDEIASKYLDDILARLEPLMTWKK